MTTDVVVLLHGLGRSSFSLLVPDLLLRRAGFRAVRIGYPSRRLGIEALAREVRSRLPDPAGGRLHFLTHSLGGIVARRLIADARPPALGRVVMLCPPNRGSQRAQRLKGNRCYRRLLGPAGQQIGTDAESVPLALPAVDFELGIITGDRTIDPAARRLDGPSDGKVRVAEARVEGMTDFLVVRRGHTFLMNDPAIVSEAVHFFRHGRFARGESAA